MATGSPADARIHETATPIERPGRDRAQAPIRWPTLDASGIVLAVIWGIGVIVALAVPGLIVGPGQETAPTSDVLMALGCTIVGCLIMIVTSYVIYRRTREVGVFVLGGVPAFTCLAGGIILAATKLTGTGTGVGVG